MLVPTKCIRTENSYNLISVIFSKENCFETEWLEAMTKTFIEFAHELDPTEQNEKKSEIEITHVIDETKVSNVPVQTQGVQESRKSLHHDQNG